ncbi:FAD-binding oxidoreductase [Clostridium sp. 'deep sea']|uniref:NAD(P)/FAD-dependent oxidoreductase n=1 Tax=Clostridium sp. 'deep sea' TaxID=2779445 RepID=UPI00189686FD|nr:FAD-dependent oxidoreductase [Clostridium sp. 'deep sea']QOR36783.1 FAD-binding oxidoreductase [Clostridium sp. 'deep sea']
MNVKGSSFFYKENVKPKQYNYLTEDLKVDVIIVGGGIGGCLLAYYMAKAGIKVAVLEKYQIASGSTCIATSLLQYELDSNLAGILDYTTEANVIRVYQLCQQALKEIDDFINNYGNECHYKKRDCLLYTAKKGEIAEIKKEFEYRVNNGFEVEFYDKKSNPFSFNLEAGIYSIGGGAVLDPFLFTHQVAKEAEKLGAKIYENTEVVKIEYEKDYVTVINNFGTKVKGEIIVAATGYNTGLFTNKKYGTFSTTFNIVTEPLPEINGWKNECVIRDNKEAYNYLRTTHDKRIIIGGEDISCTVDLCNENTAEEKYSILLDKLKAMFPNIKEHIKVAYKYCGNFASTRDNVGFIGKDPDRDKLWFALGYGANGIVYAMLAGMFLTDLYLGKENKDMQLFKLNRFEK